MYEQLADCDILEYSFLGREWVSKFRRSRAGKDGGDKRKAWQTREQKEKVTDNGSNEGRHFVKMDAQQQRR